MKKKREERKAFMKFMIIITMEAEWNICIMMIEAIIQKLNKSKKGLRRKLYWNFIDLRKNQQIKESVGYTLNVLFLLQNKTAP